MTPVVRWTAIRVDTDVDAGLMTLFVSHDGGSGTDDGSTGSDGW